jgi:ribA/ribD-fused uncharacterized protein
MDNDGSDIHFYRTGGAYGQFSDFAPFAIQLRGRRWATPEHYFQAQKFVGTPDEELVRKAPSAMIAARMGRDRSRPLRADWEEVKDDVMLDALRAKFRQHPVLGGLLLGTGDRRIVEHTANDDYWGDGGDGSGLNRLGELLMVVRQELRDGRHS